MKKKVKLLAKQKEKQEIQDKQSNKKVDTVNTVLTVVHARLSEAEAQAEILVVKEEKWNTVL